MSITCSQQRSKSYLTAKQSFITSVIEHAVVIRLRLSETSRSGKMQTSLRILLIRSWFVKIAEIQSFSIEVLAKHGRNTSAQPYRGMLMYVLIHE